MKKIVLASMILVGTLTAQADDYTYLTFETTDGVKTSVDVSSLPATINLDNSTLTVGSKTFALADLSKMYFSTQSETTGIESISNDLLTLDTFPRLWKTVMKLYVLRSHRAFRDVYKAPT